MSERTWWLVMTAWTIGVVLMVMWMWWTIKKEDGDRQLDLDYEELFTAVGEDLAREQDGYARDGVVPIKGNVWLERARRAEALQWLDDEPTRSA